MKGWTNDDRMMIACCNDGTRPVIFKIERIDIPENDEDREWLAKQNFKNTAEDAYTGRQLGFFGGKKLEILYRRLFRRREISGE